MSNLANRTETMSRWSGLPLAVASKSYFLLGQDARGDWVVREHGGNKAGIFKSREAALRFARLESRDEHFAVVHVFDGLEFDYGT